MQVQPDRGAATLLSRFARYFAQAQDCPEIAVVNVPRSQKRTASVARFDRDRFDGDGLTAADALESHSMSDGALAVCTLSIEGSLASSLNDGSLREALERARASLVFVPASGNDQLIDAASFSAALAQSNLHPLFTGALRDGRGRPSGRLAILDREQRIRAQAVPDAFRVLAVVPTFNEADIIEHTLRYLTTQGIDVHLLDNWSTDATLERARPFLGQGLVRIERFPADASPNTYDLTRILRRVEEIGREAAWADWIVLHDADERRYGPFEGTGLRASLWRAQCCGYSCIDHVTLNFWPVDDRFDHERHDVEEHFQYFEFSSHPGHFHQRRAWRRTDAPVSLAATAGHDVSFAGRRVYPYKFLLKHYPIRSRAHGIRKVLHERKARLNPIEHAGGWHLQYEDLSPEQFVREPGSLLRFDPETFADDYLIERLSSVGIYDEPPAWATPPRW
jgi:hypothetical protein